jgi:hypothetical protein
MTINTRHLITRYAVVTDNRSIITATHSVVSGVNHGEVRGTETSINVNAGEVTVSQNAAIHSNVAGGGRVTAKTITYAGLIVLSADTLNGETKSEEFNGVVVTLTFAGPNEWRLESESVINKVTILQDRRLLLEHFSGGEVTNNVQNTVINDETDGGRSPAQYNEYSGSSINVFLIIPINALHKILFLIS